jgi:hypothetical protein
MATWKCEGCGRLQLVPTCPAGYCHSCCHDFCDPDDDDDDEVVGAPAPEEDE